MPFSTTSTWFALLFATAMLGPLAGCERNIDEPRRQQLLSKTQELRASANSVDETRRRALAGYEPSPEDPARCEHAMGIRQPDGTLDNFLLLSDTTLGPLDTESRSFATGAGLRKRLADKEIDAFAARLAPGAEGVSTRMASGYEASLDESVRLDFRLPYEINLVLSEFTPPKLGSDNRFVGGAYRGKVAVYSYPDAKVLCGAKLSGSFDGLTGVSQTDAKEHANDALAFAVLTAASRAALKEIGIEGMPVVR